MKKPLQLSVLLMAAALILQSCSTVPLTGRRQLTAIPADQMLVLSAQSYATVLESSELSTKQEYITTVNRVGNRLSKAVVEFLKLKNLEAAIEGYDWQYNVIVSDQLNAFCMPGGQIAFYEGILPVCGDEAGIAVVMGHEIAHAVAQHGNERMSQELAIQMGGMALSEALKEQEEETIALAMVAFGVGAQVGVQLPYSRTHEKEADEMGLYFMAMAGYDPQAAPAFWERMEKLNPNRPPEFLSTHPDPTNRIAHLKHIMPKALEYYQAR